jgi:hypothetical protein
MGHPKGQKRDFDALERRRMVFRLSLKWKPSVSR